MSEVTLPRSWERCRFDAIAQVISGKNQKEVESPSGAYPIYGSGGTFGRSNAFLCEAGTTVIGRKGTINSPIFVNERFWNVDTAFGLCPINSTALLPRLLYYFCRSFNFAALDKSTTIPSLAKRDIEAITIPIPPLPEQKRIVAKIEELFSELEAGEASLRKSLRQLGVYRQSLLKQAFEGKLTQKWRIQNPGKLESPAKLPETEGSHALPGGWRWIKLGSAIEEPAYGTSKKCSYESGGVGVLRIPNVVNGAIEADDLKFAEFTDDERKSYELRSGDLLLIRSNGSVSIVGRCAIVEPKHTGFLYAGYLIRLRPRSTLLDSRFVLRQFASHRLRSQIEFSAKSTSGVNNINSKEIQRLVIAIPSLPEQQEIVRLLDEQFEAIERNERELDAALQRSEALRQAILKKAFSGRLVPQDQSDEPASTLLARLRAERESGVATNGRSSTKRTASKPAKTSA
jgi:type I restriction enzyme S subunit